VNEQIYWYLARSSGMVAWGLLSLFQVQGLPRLIVLLEASTPVAVSPMVLPLLFGLDRKVQIKDSFFHNANSTIRMDLWRQIPFDETVTNIEDRAWAQQVLARGYRIIYEPLRRERLIVVHFIGHRSKVYKRGKS